MVLDHLRSGDSINDRLLHGKISASKDINQLSLDLSQLRIFKSILRYVFIRFSLEERLHHMWNQMSEEMAILAEDKTQEDRVREELLNWMRQVPSVVQNILPKSSGKMTLRLLNFCMYEKLLQTLNLVLMIAMANIQELGQEFFEDIFVLPSVRCTACSPS